MSHRLNFIDHLEELRFRIIKVLVIWFLFSGLSYLYKETIFMMLVQPLEGLNFSLIHLKVYDKFATYVKVSLYVGLILTFPWFLYQVSQFILPALYIHEKKWYLVLISLMLCFFCIGTFFCYQVLIPTSLKFLINFNEKLPVKLPLKIQKSLDDLKVDLESIESKNLLRENIKILNIQKKMYTILNRLEKKIKTIQEKKNFQNNKINTYLSVSEYVDWFIFFIIAIGFIFQIPIIILVLSKIEIIDTKQLVYFRPYALIIILILSALITPPDVVSQIFIAVPIYGLYEVSIILARIIGKHKTE